MVDKISGAAKGGKKSLADLDAQIKKDSSSLKTLEAAMGHLSKSGQGSTERIQGLEKAIASKKASLASASDAVAKLAASEKKGGDAADDMGNKSSKLKTVLGGLAGAAAATATAVVGVVLGMAALSLEAAQQKSEQLALAESLTGSASAAHRVVDAQYAIGASSALAQDSVFELGNDLLKAGVSAGQYESTLKALADTSAVAGEAAVKPLEKVIKKSEQLGKFALKGADLKGSGLLAKDVYAQLAKDMGISIDKVEAKIKAGKVTAEQGIAAMNKALEGKYAKQAEGKTADFSVQMQKLKDNVKNLFSDVDTGPFLGALQKVLKMFDSTTATGKAIKGILTGAMNGFFKAAANALPYVESFLIGVAMAALDMYIALKPSIHAISEALGFDGSGTEQGLNNAAIAGKAFGYAVTASVGAIVLTIRAVIGVCHGVSVAFNAIKHAGSAVWSGMKSGLESVVGGFKKVIGKIEAIGHGAVGAMRSIGAALMGGLAGGIINNESAAVAAMNDASEKVAAASRAKFQQHSPSKVFHDIGENNMKGLGGGTERGASFAIRATRNASALTLAAANDNAQSWRERLDLRSSKAASSSSNASGGITIESGGIVFNIQTQPGQDNEAIGEIAERRLERFFERMAAASGGTR